MEIQQTSQLLAVLSAVDNRKVTELTVAGWHEVVGHLDYELARRAAIEARQNQTIDYVEPKHILAHADSIKRRDERDERIRLSPPVRSSKEAPRPANFEAMAAAWNDPVALAREKAIYNQQLIDEGFEPLYQVGDHHG